jgi:peptidoglycan/xylan/chitin deacetylase (PgdA/CDA1 family)
MNPRPRKLQVLRWLPSTLMLTTGPVTNRALYLTFDDGPEPDHTPQVLEVLAANDARASFFLLGEQVERHPAVVERIVAAGHLLGNHSYDHPHFTSLSWSEQRAQIERTDRLLGRFDGRETHRFRPPSGRFPASLLARFAMRKRSVALWSYDSLDYQRRPVVQLVETLRRNPPRAGDIVLMHDDSATTTRALELMLPEWRAAGFEMRALPQEGLA